MSGLQQTADQQSGAPALVVFGTDGAGKSHASWFEASEEALAIKAASLMGMRAIRLANDAHREVVAGVARGRVFGSGRAFVPFAKAALHARLSELAKEVGVLTTPPTDGNEAAGSASPEEVTGQVGPPEPAHRPRDWPEIQLSSLVLVSEGVGHGWYEGIVIEATPDDLFVVRWLLHPNTQEHVMNTYLLVFLFGSTVGALFGAMSVGFIAFNDGPARP